MGNPIHGSYQIAASGGVTTIVEKRMQVNMFTPSALRDVFPFTNVNAGDVGYSVVKQSRSSKTSSRT